MAPPTILYNNTAAKYTKYEQTDYSLVNAAEAALAKSMLSQDITTFNTKAPQGTMDTNYSLITPAAGSSQQLSHVVIDHQQTDLGSVFAIAAQHDNDNTQGVASSDAPSHLSFSTTSGSIGVNLGINASGSIYVTNDSASYYDSQLLFQTDNTEHEFNVNEDNINKYNVTFDTTSTNFNAEKAVNSRYSNYLTGGLASANPDLNKTDPLAISEHTTFNTNYSLYSENIISRNVLTNALSAGGAVTSSPGSLTNLSGQSYFGNNEGFGSGYIGIADDKHNASNDEVFFGAVRLTQQINVVLVTGSAAGSSTTTLARVPSDPGSNLPTSLTASEFSNLFTADELPYAGAEYHLTVEQANYGSTGDYGGYYIYGADQSGSFRGFSSDDNDVKRNTVYMRKCAEEGQNFSTSVQTVEINNGDLVADREFDGPNADLLTNRIDDVAVVYNSDDSNQSSFLSSNDSNISFPTVGSFIKTGGNGVFSRVDSSTLPYNSCYVGFTIPTIPTGVLDLQIRNTISIYQIFINGSNFSFQGTGISGTFNAGDFFEFETTSSGAKYYKNGTLLATRSLLSGTAPLYLYFGANTVGDTLTGIKFGTSRSSANPGNGLPIPHDTDENLNSSNYQDDYFVRTYFTEPSTSVSATYHRAEGDTGNSSNYTDLRVVYDANEGVLSQTVLPDDRRSRYYENFQLNTIFPNTSITGDVFSGANYIGRSNGFAAVFQDGNAGTNANSDYTFTSTSTAANLLAANEVSIIQLVNTQYLSNEDSLYVDGATGPLPYTNTTVIGTNINFTNIANPSNGSTTDLRIKLSNKTGLSSAFTNDWSSSLSSGSVLKTDLETAGIFGNSIGSIMTNISSTAGNTDIIPINFELLTNGTSDNQDSLNISMAYNWAYNSLSGSGIIHESDISLTGTIPSAVTTTLTLGTHYNLASGLTTAVQNLLGSYDLVRNVETRTTTPSFTFDLGAYSNITITGKELDIRTVYHTLVHKVTGAHLPDSYIKNINLTSSYLSDLNTLGYGQSKASRQIIGSGKTSVLSLAISDLYNFTAVVQKRDDTSPSGWSDVSPSYDFDGAHGNFTTFTLNSNAGSIDASIDITTSPSNNVVLDQSTYYIELSTGNGLTSYSVAAKKWDINTLADAQAINTWSASNNVSSVTMPNGGTSLSLTATVTSSPVAGQPSTQPDVTITVTDTNGVIWANFLTNGVKATSSFNILFSRRPVFQIIENYKNVSITTGANGVSWSEASSVSSTTTYKMAGTATGLQVINGIELTFVNDIAINDSASYTLLGDYLQASLYSTYSGPYSSITEVTFSNGLLIGDAYARNIEIKYYRGNSVRTASSPATYEEFRWTRTPTQIYMKIVNTNSSNVVTTYTDTADNLYNGSTHVVDDLSGGIGDLGLKFYGSLSRFRSVNTSYTSQDVAMTQPITILFDSYQWTISNPFNTTAFGQVNAVAGSAVVSTNYYSIRNYTGSNAMNIVASRVWIRHSEEEIFDFYYTTPPMQIDYLAEQYVGNPSTFNWSTAVNIDSIPYADLQVGQHIQHPSGNGDSHIYIKFAPVVIQAFVSYFVLPRPQTAVEVIPTNIISSLPYNYDTATRTTRYFDINIENNSHFPFSGTFGVDGAGTRVINNMNIQYRSFQSEKYIDKVYNANSSKHRIYIPSNKITIDLYKGYTSHSVLDANSKITTVYQGYIHKLKNYDVDAYTSSQSITDSTPNNPLVTDVFNKYDNTYIDGTFNADNNMAYDFSFTQDHSIISPEISSDDLFGQLGNKVLNIKIKGVNPFMRLNNVLIANRHLDLLPGDSVKLVLYGHTFTSNGDGDLVAQFVRYTTGTGYDLTTNAGTLLIKNLGFNASTREVATVVLKTNTNVLTSVPYNFVNICNTKVADNTFNSLTWVTDSSWASKTVEEKQLAFSITCLSTSGVSKLASIFAVTDNSFFRMLVCNYPNMVDLRSGDGSPIYVVSGFGKLLNMSLFTQTVRLSPETHSLADTDVNVFMAYNNLDNNTL
jgi:hypothetical protein